MSNSREENIKNSYIPIRQISQLFTFSHIDSTSNFILKFKANYRHDVISAIKTTFLKNKGHFSICHMIFTSNTTDSFFKSTNNEFILKFLQLSPRYYSWLI